MTADSPVAGISASDWSRARGFVAGASRITVLTGAGISTDSGIADFRGPKGVWTRDPEAEKLATITHYLGDAEIRRRAWRARLRSPVWDARPNIGHQAIVGLEQRGRLHLLVTQNVDGLHRHAGHAEERVVEVHGNARRVRCWACGVEDEMAAVLVRVEAGEDDPPCLECGGILKSTTILFGEDLVPGDLERALAAAEEADLLLAVGTSLAVGPVNRMVPLARRAGVPVVVVNGEPTEMDHLADVVLLGAIAEVLPELLGEC